MYKMETTHQKYTFLIGEHTLLSLTAFREKKIIAMALKPWNGD